MKFGVEYQDALQKGEYPSPWIDSAISYKKLKKCIKRVREELLSLGLDRETLEALWQHVGPNAISSSNNPDAERMMQYQFSGEEGVRFVPKLTVALDPSDGSPMDAWLSPDTRNILQRVGTHRQRRRSSIIPPDTQNGSNRASLRLHQQVDTADEVSNLIRCHSDSHSHVLSPNDDENNQDLPMSANSCSKSGLGTITSTEVSYSGDIETVEVPLNSDSEFFQVLKKELQALEHLEEGEQDGINKDIKSLGKDLEVLKEQATKNKRARAELDIWREIFRLYIESSIFMSNHETDAGARNAAAAANQLRYFTKQLSSVKTNPPKPKSSEARIALDRFLNINTNLLRLLKFQELNRRALGKILKKFDKQTSLHAINPTTPDDMLKALTIRPNRPAVSPHDLARTTAYAISSSLLSLIPQLDDYLCPICSWITYKPIRLRCNHVFCIRCMIRMQQEDKDECPLCRKKVVLEATDYNIDFELKRFLKREFKAEVTEKQRENELQAGKEVFGESYEGTHRCAVM